MILQNHLPPKNSLPSPCRLIKLRRLWKPTSKGVKMESEKKKLRSFMTVLAVIALVINFSCLAMTSSIHARNSEAANAMANQNAAKTEHDNFLAKYIDNTFTKPPGIQTVALLVAADNGNSNRAVKEALAHRLETSGVKMLPSFFKPAFVADGLFENTFNGSGDIPAKLELGKYLDAIVLARQHVEIKQNGEAMANVLTATIRLDVTIIPNVGNARSQTWTFTANGAGFNQSVAQAQAEERLIKQITSDTKMSLK